MKSEMERAGNREQARNRARALIAHAQEIQKLKISKAMPSRNKTTRFSRRNFANTRFQNREMKSAKSLRKSFATLNTKGRTSSIGGGRP